MKSFRVVLWENIERIAATTGTEVVPDYKKKMGYAFECNKFERAGLTSRLSECVAPARVAECPIQIEAELVRMHKIGADAESMVAVELKALCVHVRTTLLARDGKIDLDLWNPLHYVFRHYFALGRCLGKNFRA